MKFTLQLPPKVQSVNYRVVEPLDLEWLSEDAFARKLKSLFYTARMDFEDEFTFHNVFKGTRCED